MKLKQALRHQKDRFGFTLIETVLVVSLFAVLTGLSIPVYYSFQVRNDLVVASNNVSQSLKRAQLLSQAVAGDSNWGVHIVKGTLTIYKGPNYIGRDPAYDELFDLSNSVTPSLTDVTDVNFAKMTGLPQNTGNIVLTSTSGESKTLIVNSQGMVSY